MLAPLDPPQEIPATFNEEGLRLLSLAQNGTYSIRQRRDAGNVLLGFQSLYPIDLTSYVAPIATDPLAIYAKGKRDEVEAAGITVNGVAVASAPDDQTRVNNAYSGMLVTGAASIRFKATDGFIVLSLEQLKAVGSALFAHTQACFDAEDKVDAGLSASPPTITTTAQIDAVFDAVPKAY